MEQILKLAFSQYGIKEIAGNEKNNPEILKYFTEIGHKWVKTDETAWCSAYVNWCAKKSGFEYSGKLDARSWLNVGKQVFTPQLGDIVIFWRESLESWKGHVAFYINHIYINYINDIHNNIYCLGGNQGNMVQILPYPKTRLLGFRRLSLLKNKKQWHTI